MGVGRILAAAALAVLLHCSGGALAQAGETQSSAAPDLGSWSRRSLPDGALVYTSQDGGKVVVLAEVRSSPRGRTVDFSRVQDRQRHKALSDILMELGYCSRRALYDTVLHTAYCKGDFAGKDGRKIPLAAYLKLEDRRFLLMMALQNADRRDILDVIRRERIRTAGSAAAEVNPEPAAVTGVDPRGTGVNSGSSPAAH